LWLWLVAATYAAVHGRATVNPKLTEILRERKREKGAFSLSMKGFEYEMEIYAFILLIIDKFSQFPALVIHAISTEQWKHCMYS